MKNGQSVVWSNLIRDKSSLLKAGKDEVSFYIFMQDSMVINWKS